MAEPDENPFGDPTVGHPFQVIFRTPSHRIFNTQHCLSYCYLEKSYGR